MKELKNVQTTQVLLATLYTGLIHSLNLLVNLLNIEK